MSDLTSILTDQGTAFGLSFLVGGIVGAVLHDEHIAFSYRLAFASLAAIGGDLAAVAGLNLMGNEVNFWNDPAIVIGALTGYSVGGKVTDRIQYGKFEDSL